MPRGFIYPQTTLELFDWWVAEYCQAGSDKRAGRWWQVRLGIGGAFTKHPPNTHYALLELKRLARPVDFGGFGQMEVMCTVITEERLRLHAQTRQTNSGSRLDLAQYFARERVRHIRDFPTEALCYARSDILMDLSEHLAITATTSFEWAPIDHDSDGNSGTTLSSESGSYPSSLLGD